MRDGKYVLSATLGALAIIGMLTLACKCGKDKSTENKEIDETIEALESLSKLAKEVDKYEAATDPDTAKISIDESSIFVERTKYSTTVYCNVSNDGSAWNGASLKATFKDASGTIVGTASGYVNDIGPGKKKPVYLYSSDKVSADSTLKVEVDTIYGYGNEGEDDLSFKNISVKKKYGYPKVMGEVTNNGTEDHSFSLYAAFHDADGKLIGYANCSPVSDLASAQTKTFDCHSPSKLKSWDEVKIGVAILTQ